MTDSGRTTDGAAVPIADTGSDPIVDSGRVTDSGRVADGGPLPIADTGSSAIPDTGGPIADSGIADTGSGSIPDGGGAAGDGSAVLDFGVASSVLDTGAGATSDGGDAPDTGSNAASDGSSLPDSGLTGWADGGSNPDLGLGGGQEDGGAAEDFGFGGMSDGGAVADLGLGHREGGMGNPDSGGSPVVYQLTVGSGTYGRLGSGTQLSFSSTDDGYAELVLPFGFSFFGESLAAGHTVYVSTNGTLDFYAPSVGYQNVTVPTTAHPNGFVGAFWDDMEVTRVLSRVVGPVGGQLLIVEWQGLRRLGTGDAIDVQIRLHEADDRVEIWYGARTGGPVGSATIGVEDVNGTTGTSLPCSPTCTFDDVPDDTVLTLQASQPGPPGGDQ